MPGKVRPDRRLCSTAVNKSHCKSSECPSLFFVSLLYLPVCILFVGKKAPGPFPRLPGCVFGPPLCQTLPLTLQQSQAPSVQIIHADLLCTVQYSSTCFPPRYLKKISSQRSHTGVTRRAYKNGTWSQTQRRLQSLDPDYRLLKGRFYFLNKWPNNITLSTNSSSLVRLMMTKDSFYGMRLIG